METIDILSAIALMIGVVLLAIVRIICRQYGGTAADGAIIGAFLSEIIAAFVVFHSPTPLGSAVLVVATAIAAWMVIVWIAFNVRASMISLPDLDAATHSCVPKKTVGQDTRFERTSRSGFTRLWAKFRCSPSDSNLTQGVIARTLRLWGYGWSGVGEHIRHTISIQCIEECRPLAILTGDTEAGGEELRVKILNHVFYSRDSVNVEVKMYAAMGAPTFTLQLAGRANYWIPVPGLPSVPVQGSSQVNVIFPNAGKVFALDMGLYQWRCLAAEVPATAIVPHVGPESTVPPETERP